MNLSTVAPRHGTVQRYRDRNCRCKPCTNANTMYRRATRHAVSGLRPPGCRCTTCAPTPERRLAAEEEQRRLRRNRTREYQARKAAGGNPVDVWAFERHALHPARPAAVTTTAKSVVCCEREAFEVEGAGHDELCPTVTASNHSGGDAA